MYRKTAYELPLAGKIYVAGHNSLVGAAVLRRLSALGYKDLVTKTSKELDLTSQWAVSQFFKENQPQYVFLCAEEAGGILAKSTYPASCIYDNLMIQSNIIHQSMKYKVKRLLFLGSSSVYPTSSQPMKEEQLLKGPLEPLDRSYAFAKAAGIEMCGAYNKQYGTRYLSVIPTDAYGPEDNYDLKTSHVLPAILRKMHEAKLRNDFKVDLWGTGKAKREFLHSDDLADALILLLGLPESKYQELLHANGHLPVVNVGSGQPVTIQELASMVAQTVGFKGELSWDTNKPTGAPSKLLDVSQINALGWKAKISLRTGIEKTYSQSSNLLNQLMNRHEPIKVKVK
jgi:GDP-L-fucose synthase